MTVQIVHRSFRTNLLDRANENKSYANTFIKHLHISNTDATDGADEPEVVQINLRLSKAFLEDIDTTWKQEGFNSRSEFLRHVAHNAEASRVHAPGMEENRHQRARPSDWRRRPRGA